MGGWGVGGGHHLHSKIGKAANRLHVLPCEASKFDPLVHLCRVELLRMSD